MQIKVNGEPQELADASSVQQLLAHLELTQGRIALELNGEIVPRSTFNAVILQDGDRVEIVQAIGGG